MRPDKMSRQGIFGGVQLGCNRMLATVKRRSSSARVFSPSQATSLDSCTKPTSIGGPNKKSALMLAITGILLGSPF